MATLLMLPPLLPAEVSFSWASIGDAGNAGDPLVFDSALRHPNIGAVAYGYQIAQFEVTISQYAEFLNAAAKSDPFGLYSSGMATNLSVAGISRMGTSGNYNYSVIGNGNRPISYIGWSDAARFVNWLTNGQGAGSTEFGSYDMSLPTPTRSETARYVLPTLDEWYKAAYCNPEADGLRIYTPRRVTPLWQAGWRASEPSKL